MAKEMTQEEKPQAVEPKKAQTPPSGPMNEYETVILPRATGKEEGDEFVAINGKGYTIRKGQPVRVPKPVAAILEERQRQRKRQNDFMDQMTDQASQQTKLGL